MADQIQSNENRIFMIFNINELPSIDFNEVLESSIDTVRISIDGTKTFVKWEGLTPQCVLNLTTQEGPYNYSEMLSIISTSEWTNQM